MNIDINTSLFFSTCVCRILSGYVLRRQPGCMMRERTDQVNGEDVISWPRSLHEYLGDCFNAIAYGATSHADDLLWCVGRVNVDAGCWVRIQPRQLHYHHHHHQQQYQYFTGSNKRLNCNIWYCEKESYHLFTFIIHCFIPTLTHWEVATSDDQKSIETHTHSRQ